jgi:hypothetical protein
MQSPVLASAVLAAALALAGCGDSKANATSATSASASASASAAASIAPSPTTSAPPKPAVPLTQDSVTFMPVGKWDRKEGDKKDWLWWSIRNTAPKKLTGVSVVVYYYDLKQRQIGRKTLDQKVEIPTRATREMQIGVAKQNEPRGTQYRDAVFTKATFEDGTVFEDAAAAPEQKPYRGAMPVPTPD